jgi:hypothetical protein
MCRQVVRDQIRIYFSSRGWLPSGSERGCDRVRPSFISDGCVGFSPIAHDEECRQRLISLLPRSGDLPRLMRGGGRSTVTKPGGWPRCRCMRGLWDSQHWVFKCLGGLNPISRATLCLLCWPNIGPSVISIPMQRISRSNGRLMRSKLGFGFFARGSGDCRRRV